MGEETYFVITSNEDGVNIESMSQEELLKGITPDANGDVDIPNEFYDHIPKVGWAYWEEDKAIIIKGKIVVPKAEDVVTKFNVE